MSRLLGHGATTGKGAGLAWVDDRIWCHPKFVDLSSEAFRVWVNGAAYSTGFGTRGRLTRGQQRTIGATAKTRRELEQAGLWEADGDDVVYHDWADYNSSRDDRRERDRERKRLQRVRGHSGGTSAGTSAGRSTGTARGEGSEGSEGSDGSDGNEGREGSSKDSNSLPSPPAATISEALWRKLVHATRATNTTDIRKLERAVRAHATSESVIASAIEAANGKTVRDPLAAALAELKRRNEQNTEAAW